MLRRDQAAASNGRPIKDREGHLAAEHVVDLRSLIDDLIHRDEAECHLAPVDDRAKAAAGRTNSHAGQRRFGDRRRPDALGAKLLEQRRQRVGRHVEDLGIAPHLLGDGFEGGLVIRKLPHRALLASGRKHVVARLLG